MPISKIFFGSQGAGDRCHESVGLDEPEAREADGVNRRQHDLPRLVAAEESGEVGVLDLRKSIAGVKGALADIAAE